MKWITRLLNLSMAVLAAVLIGVILYGSVLPQRQATEKNAGNASPLPSEELRPELTLAPSVTPEPTPALAMPEKQLDILNKMLTAFQNEDAQQAGLQLKAWEDLRRNIDGESEGQWVDMTGFTFVNNSFVKDYTGIGLASDGAARFYYGPLQNGQPNGEGLRITIYSDSPTSNPDAISYFWTDGEWENGIMVGEADIYLDEAPQNSDSELQNSMHIHCAFDGSEDEIMISGSIKMTEVVSYVEDTGYQQRASSYNFAIMNGKLMDAEWEADKYNEGLYVLDSIEGNGDSLITNKEDVGFQNPYPWQKKYRYAYRGLFGLWIF